ncbi:hypothetical protein [Pinirhizobacter soli]|uniref:hypothetical protein n=1 Tax=Pinirhizobacter soli TaxID=2786953 RepID=UPI00202A8054|nr:hypothetical protein [Pinirhizobacter soli]
MDDVEALSTIVATLRALDDESQRRVLASVSAFLGMQHPGPNHPLQRVESPIIAVANPAGESSFSTDRTMSAKDFLREKQPVTDVERVACLAYYLTHYKGTPHFKTIDISSLNVDAAQPKFSSASVAVDNARARGLLVPSTKGNKQLSAIGEKYVELLPDRDAAKESLSNSKNKRLARKPRTRRSA